jgi:hypothetical protein
MSRAFDRIAFLFAIAPMLAPCLPAEASTTYDMVKEFSIKKNPAGVWSYRSTLDNLPLAKSHSSCWGVAGLDCWYDHHVQPGNRTMIGINTTGQTVTWDHGNVIYTPGYIMIDPEHEGDGYVQFTAPVAGTYTVKGRYVPLALKVPHKNFCYIDQMGSKSKDLWFSKVDSHGPKRFNLSVPLAQGDMLQFEVRRPPGKNPSYTGLTAKITGP